MGRFQKPYSCKLFLQVCVLLGILADGAVKKAMTVGIATSIKCDSLSVLLSITMSCLLL